MASSSHRIHIDPTRWLWLLEKQQDVSGNRPELGSAIELNMIFALAYDRARCAYLLIGDIGGDCGSVVLDEESAQGIIRHVQRCRHESTRDQGLESAQTRPRLYTKEIQVLQAVADGLTNRGIASRLGITENTTKRHLQSIFSKLGVQSRTQAVMVSLREGWLSSISSMQVNR